MVADGFPTNSPEFLAAELYFGQTPSPTYLWVGRQDLTGIFAAGIGNAAGIAYKPGDPVVVVQSLAAGGQLTVSGVDGLAGAVKTVTLGSTVGSGYTPGDIITITQGGGVGGKVQVSTVSAGGVPTAVVLYSGALNSSGYTVANNLATTGGTGTGLTIDVTVVYLGAVTALAIGVGAQGTGYSVASNLASTSTGAGTGLTVNVTAIGESPVQAVAACRLQNPDWYIVQYVGTAIDSDYLAIAAFVESSPATVHFVTSSEAGIPNGTTSTLPGLLQAAKYRRTLVMYSTTQGNVYPNNQYAVAGAAGYAMGANSEAPGSYFDLNNKTLEGIAPEPLTATQILNIRGACDRTVNGLNCNLLVNYQNKAYTLFQLGTMSDGTWFDEVLFVDMLVADIQASLMAYITSVGAIPINNAGVQTCKSIISAACQRSQTIGFMATSGIWQEGKIGIGAGSLNFNDAMPSGYFLYAPLVSSLSPAQRSARVMPPITVAMIEAQSMHSLAISLQVQQ
jgi:hypothetical protein